MINKSDADALWYSSSQGFISDTNHHPVVPVAYYLNQL